VRERAAAARLAARLEPRLRLVEERALAEGVLAALARLLHEVEALGDLALRIPVRSLERALRARGAVPRLALRAGEGDLARVDLLDEAGAVAGDVARARVEDGRAERLGQLAQVVDA